MSPLEPSDPPQGSALSQQPDVPELPDVQERPKQSKRSKRQELPEYAACEQCNEYHREALRVLRDSSVLCANCADTTSPRRRCPICWRVAAAEVHHLASARQHPMLTLRVCLNCHSRLSVQQRCWPPAWRTEPHPVRCIVQGVWDVLALWCEKHRRTFSWSRELFAMLGYAALSLLPYLRPAALRDLGGLQDSTDWSPA